MRERSRKLKQHIHDMNDAGVRYTTFYTLVNGSLRETKDEPVPIRRARAFAHLLDSVEQAVLPYELVAGSIAGMWPLAEDLPSFTERLDEARRVVAGHFEAKDEGDRLPGPARWALMARDHYDANISFDDLQEITRRLEGEYSDDERVTYSEIYRVLEQHFEFDYGEEVRENFRDLPWFASNHLHLNYGKGVRRGLGDILREIEKRKARAETEERTLFYESTRIAVGAAIRFICRYAGTLRDQAARADVPEARAAELRRMATICDTVAEGAPETFREALQLTWMLHIIGNIGGGSALSLGRLDQYLYPFYERDMAEGRLTREEAGELLECVWLKVNEPHMRTVQSACLAGVDAAGDDATNELSYICLDVVAATREPYPNTCVRVHEETPDELWERIVEVVRLGFGQPQVYNDEVMVPGLVRSGYPVEDARDYYPMGCVEVMLHGKQPTWGGAGAVVFPGMIESVLNNGAVDYAGEEGARTGGLESLETFDDFLAAYLKQVEYRVRALLDAAVEGHRQARRERYDPYASALVDDCLEKGTDICRGGARYPTIFAVGSMGLGTAVDSLSAIETYVYDRGELTLSELKEMLEQDFTGNESVRQLLERGTPAYGNDVEHVDEIAEKVYNAYVHAVHDYEPAIPGVPAPNMFSYTSHVRRGEVTAATPNGRFRGEPISDALGPSQGKDVSGPTCLLSSVTKLDYSWLTGGCAFNLKLNPSLVSGPDVLESLMRTYVAEGGLQIQINMIGEGVLRKAQQDPDRYRHVIVRVAGFCEYFTNLDRKLQDEIIERTSQEAVHA